MTTTAATYDGQAPHYAYIDREANELAIIKDWPTPGRMLIQITDAADVLESNRSGAFVDNHQAVDVALAILKAAGQMHHLETAAAAASKPAYKVTEDKHGYLNINGGYYAKNHDLGYWRDLVENRAEDIRNGLIRLEKDRAVLAYLEAKQAAAEAEKLTKRRDEATREWSQVFLAQSYAELNMPARKMIDRVIELEDGK